MLHTSILYPFPNSLNGAYFTSLAFHKSVAPKQQGAHKIHPKKGANENKKKKENEEEQKGRVSLDFWLCTAQAFPMKNKEFFLLCLFQLASNFCLVNNVTASLFYPTR